jgi:hypothetical protein
MPALITGRLLSNAELVNRSKLMLTFADSDRPVNCDGQPNLFSKARQAGFNTSLVGWYIPYCNLFAENLTSCSWIDNEASSLSECISSQVEDLISNIPLASAFVIVSRIETNKRNERTTHSNDYRDVLTAAKRAIADPGPGLILVHWPVPHPPGIYSRHENQIETNVESSYLDNLQLVDSTLGELRRMMEDAGTWDHTILLVTSDHWLRSFWKTIGPDHDRNNEIVPSDNDQRVPFLLKLADQRQAITYDSVFNNVLAHDLVLALLRGEISAPEGVVSWLDHHRSIGPTPYHFNLSQ